MVYVNKSLETKEVMSYSRELGLSSATDLRADCWFASYQKVIVRNSRHQVMCAVLHRKCTCHNFMFSLLSSDMVAVY